MKSNKSKLRKRRGAVRSSALVSPRERLMSYFSWLMGGWNASPGIHAGRLAFEPNYADDEAMARMILETHKSHVTYELKQEIQQLKAALYDVTKRANAELNDRR